MIPPTKANARPERVARQRTERSDSTSGHRTHGDSASGHTSTEVIATSLRMRGHSAKATAATRRAHGFVTPKARDSRHIPRRATVITVVHQRRCTTQPGTPTAFSTRWKGPTGKR